MEPELDGGEARFIVAVEDVSGVWGVLKPVLDARTTWRGLTLRNKVGNAVAVPQLHVQFMLSGSARLTRLRQHAQSPVTWFRNPYVQLVLISGDDPDEYKRAMKGQLRRVLEADRDLLGGAPEFVIAYLQPAGGEPHAKGARKVFEAVRSDLGTRKRDRAVRLELGPRGGVTPGSVAELERQLGEALRQTFEARQAAYDEEVRKLAAARQQPGWSFATLFLVKDSLAVMLEAAGLLEDALREYAELEALYLTTLQPPDAPNAPPFGGTSPGDDVAQLVRATWRETRQAVLRSGGLPQFDLQQFLFACQARILLKLDRPAEVAQRGLAAVDSFAGVLERQTAAGRLPPLFQSAWAFSACLSLAHTTARVGPPPPTPKPAAGPGGALPPLPTGAHRRAASELALAHGGSLPGPQRHTRSLGAGEFAAISEGSTGEASSTNDAPSLPADSDEESEAATPLAPDARQASAESATLAHRRQLPRVRVGREPSGGAAQAKSAGRGGRSSRRREEREAEWRLQQPRPEVDWHLGVASSLLGEAAPEAGPADGSAGEPAGARQRAFWCLLGHLYLKARLALDALSERLELPASTPKTPQFAGANGSFGGHWQPPERSASLGGGHIVAPAGGARASSQLTSAESAIATPKAELGSRGGTFETVPSIPQQQPQPPQQQPGHGRRLSRFGLEAAPGRGEAAAGGLPPPAPHAPHHGHSHSHGHSRRGSVVSEVSTAGLSEAESVGSLIRRSSDPDAARLEPDLRNIQTVEREVETASEDSGSPSSGRFRRGSGDDSPTAALPWLTEWRLRLALASAGRCQELWAELSGAAAACYAAAGWRRTAERLTGQVAAGLLWRGHLPAAAALTRRRARLLLRERWGGLAAGALLELLECERAVQQAPDLALCLRLLGADASPAAVPNPLRAELQEALVAAAAAGERPPPATDGLTAENADGSLACAGVLSIEPLPSHYSRFFGQSEVDGEPITSASRQAPEGLPAGSGAPRASVGDVLRVPVAVFSRLPRPLRVAGCQLVLSVLQEMTVVLSPRGGQEQPLTRGHGHLRTASLLTVDTPLANAGGRPEPPTPATAAANGAGEQRFGTKWQETERVRCAPLLPESQAPGDGAEGQQQQQQQQQQGQQLTLQPGRNVLWFEVTPLKRGLYALRHADVALGSLRLRLASSRLGQGAGPLGACDDATGTLGEEAVLLAVEPAARRVSTRAVAPAACLIAGTPQWLGVALLPQHDTLQAASLRLQPSAAAPVPLELLQQPTPWIAPTGEPEAGSSGRAVGQAWQPDSSGAAPLPAWAAAQPSLLWLWVRAGPWAVAREVVRVSPLSAHTPLRPQPAELPTPVTSPPAVVTAAAGPHSAAELDLDVAYSCGCSRGHSARLSLPVLPPFRVKVTGKELPGGRVVLQVQLASCLAGPATLTGVDLEPQPGFALQPPRPELAALLPMEVPAGGSASLLLFLAAVEGPAPEQEARGGRLDSLLSLRFAHAPGRPPPTALQEVGNEWTPPLLRAPPPPPPPAELPADAGEGVQRHAFTLDLGAASAAPRSTVYVRLLGPFSARAGEAVTFCWRLERGPEAAADQQGGLLQYEVRAEGEVWRPPGARSGWVRLPPAARSAATVEAAWVAGGPGLLPVPQLLLPDVPHQEVFEVGDDNHLITVS